MVSLNKYYTFQSSLQVCMAMWLSSDQWYIIIYNFYVGTYHNKAETYALCFLSFLPPPLFQDHHTTTWDNENEGKTWGRVRQWNKDVGFLMNSWIRATITALKNTRRPFHSHIWHLDQDCWRSWGSDGLFISCDLSREASLVKLSLGVPSRLLIVLSQSSPMGYFLSLSTPQCPVLWHLSSFFTLSPQVIQLPSKAAEWPSSS